MVVAAANRITKHDLKQMDIDAAYLDTDPNFLRNSSKRRHRMRDDDILSMRGVADANGVLKVRVLKDN